MIRGLWSLNTLSVDLIISHKTVLSATYKTDKTVFLYFIVIIHVSSAWGTTWNFINRFLYRIHIIWYWWNKYGNGHFKTIIQWCIIRHVGIWKIVSTWIVLRVFCISLELLLKFGLLFCHLYWLRHKLRGIYTLWSTWLSSSMSLLLPFLK